MQQIKAKMIELIDIASARVQQCDVDASVNASNAMKNKDKEAELTALESALRIKESKLKKLQALKDIQGAMIEAGDRKKASEASTKKMLEDFQKYREEEEQKLKQKEKELRLLQEKIEDENRKLSDDKKNYRAKIIEDVHAQMNARGR